MGQQSSQPLPQRPPSSRRTSSHIIRAQRKRSLELPEFHALTLANAPSHRSTAIPIPMAATVFQQPPSPPHSKARYFPQPAVHPQRTQRWPDPVPPVDVQKHHQPRQPPAPVQPPVASSSRAAKPSVVKEDALLVRSRLPTGLLPPAEAADQDDAADQAEGTQDATITWRGSAKEVYLAGISDSDRPYRVKMFHEPGSKSTFFTTLRLPPGNHPLRFIVDDQPRCTDTLPTATDTDGTLINYIEIPSPTHSPTRSRSSTATTAAVTPNGWADGGAGSVLDAQASGSGKYYQDMEWSGDIPPRLFRLAAEEEAYLAARAAATQHPTSSSSSRHSSQQYSPLPPPPPVPYPPSLPRHLEKVILNSSSSRSPNYTPAILASSSSARPRIIGTGTTGPLIPAPGPRPRAGTVPVSAAENAGPRPGVSSSILMHQTGIALESLGDDNSVLPVPNHVVLNHLGTSAIKNGVLAVGTTTRYHRKYISTIYYKPI